MTFDQGELNFEASSGEDGYREWQEEIAARRSALEKRWGIILNRRVRVKLVDRDVPLEGKLILLDTGKPRPDRTRRRQLRFCLQGKEFSQAEIESVVRLD